MTTQFSKTEIEAIERLADDYVQAGGLDINLPADSFGVMFVASIRDKARVLLDTPEDPLTPEMKLALDGAVERRVESTGETKEQAVERAAAYLEEKASPRA